MIKAVLWDNDGVLVDTEKLFFEATKNTLASVGVELSRDVFVEYSLIKGVGLREYLTHYNLNPGLYESLSKKRRLKYSKLLETKTELIEGINQTLKSLHNHYKMGIVTSSRKQHFEIIHKNTNILKYFDFVLVREDYTNSKPDPEPYLKGLEMIDVKPEECIVIEDSARGLKSANRAGIFCLMIPNQLSLPETYVGNYKLLKDCSEILDFLLN